MCYRCPRGKYLILLWHLWRLTSLGKVFHPECYGLSKAHVNRTPLLMCSQHKCHLCFRITGDAGGMLFRYVFHARIP